MSKTFEEVAYEFHAMVVKFCEDNPDICIAASVVNADRNATVMNLSPSVMTQDNFCIHRAIVEMSGDLCKAFNAEGITTDRDMHTDLGEGETRQ